MSSIKRSLPDEIDVTSPGDNGFDTPAGQAAHLRTIEDEVAIEAAFRDYQLGKLDTEQLALELIARGITADQYNLIALQSRITEAQAADCAKWGISREDVCRHYDGLPNNGWKIFGLPDSDRTPADYADWDAGVSNGD